MLFISISIYTAKKQCLVSELLVVTCSVLFKANCGWKRILHVCFENATLFEELKMCFGYKGQ